MVMFDLTEELGIIEVSGADSQTFLQGQLTNDIKLVNTPPQISANQSEQILKLNFQLSAHLNNKGRMLASFIVTSLTPNSYYLITTKEIIDKIIPRLKMFVLRSKVNINKLTARLLFISNVINNSNSDISAVENSILTNISPTPIYVLTMTPQYHLYIIPETISGIKTAELVNCIVNKAVVDSATNIKISTDTSSWKDCLINNGIPLIYNNTQEVFIPQHLNYDLLNGVNFKKGCYTGQEIVARTHYLGKVKRRMFQFTYTAKLSAQMTAEFKLNIGQNVISPKLNNQEVGVIVDLVKHENYSGLVSLQPDCIDSAFFDIANQQQLTVKEISYTKNNHALL